MKLHVASQVACLLGTQTHIFLVLLKGPTFQASYSAVCDRLSRKTLCGARFLNDFLSRNRSMRLISFMDRHLHIAAILRDEVEHPSALGSVHRQEPGVRNQFAFREDIL